jgi:hypothetical protein
VQIPRNRFINDALTYNTFSLSSISFFLIRVYPYPIRFLLFFIRPIRIIRPIHVTPLPCTVPGYMHGHELVIVDSAGVGNADGAGEKLCVQPDSNRRPTA